MQFQGANELQGQPTAAPHAPLLAGLNSPLSRRYPATIIPYESGAENGLVEANLTLAKKRLTLSHCSGHMRAGARQRILYPLSTKRLKVLCNLIPSDPLASWSHGVAKWGQDAKMSKQAVLRDRPG